MAKEIKSTNGLIFIVDDEDFDWINQYKWYAWKHGYTYYIKRAEWVKGGRGKAISVLLHREIMRPGKGLQVDHLDRNGLNNQKHNMVNCTQAENNQNKRKKYKITKRR